MHKPAHMSLWRAVVETEAKHIDKSRKTEAPFKIYKMLDSKRIFRQHLPVSKSACVKACEAMQHNPKGFRAWGLAQMVRCRWVWCWALREGIVAQDHAYREAHQGCRKVSRRVSRFGRVCGAWVSAKHPVEPETSPVWTDPDGRQAPLCSVERPAGDRWIDCRQAWQIVILHHRSSQVLKTTRGCFDETEYWRPTRLAQAFWFLTAAAAREDRGWKRLVCGFHAAHPSHIADDDARVWPLQAPVHVGSQA